MMLHAYALRESCHSAPAAYNGRACDTATTDTGTNDTGTNDKGANDRGANE